jgi:ribonucleoside-triphosphate reductase
LTKTIKLSNEFLAQYKGKQPKWGFGGLGYIVYLRTYSRKKADGTLERWDETVRRFTEGNFQIEANRLAAIGKLTNERLAQLTEEMERFYHLAFNLVITPPGRGLWMSGTPYAEKVGDAENNCWNVSMRPQEYVLGDGKPRVSFAPVFTFDQAMKGGGKLPS